MSLGSQINVDKFINAVYTRGPLWDQRDDGHHNRFILNKLWDDVGKEFGITRDVARSKWKSLRDKFRGIISRNPETEHRGHIWPHFQSLLFLRDQFLSESSYSDGFSILSEHLQCKIEQTSSTTDEHFDEKFLNGIEVVSSPRNSPNPSHGRLSPTEEPTRKRQHDSSGGVCADDRKRRRYDSDDDDEDLNFFKSLVPHIRSISSYEKLSLRIKIMQCIQGYITTPKGKAIEHPPLPMTTTITTTNVVAAKQPETQQKPSENGTKT